MLKLFTWLTNLGALGVLRADGGHVVRGRAFFRRRPDPTPARGARSIAPLVAGVLMLGMLVLGVANFNVLITSATDAPTDTMSIVLPLILFGAGVAGCSSRRASAARDPERYERIGERTAVEQAEHVA